VGGHGGLAGWRSTGRTRAGVRGFRFGQLQRLVLLILLINTEMGHSAGGRPNNISRLSQTEMMLTLVCCGLSFQIKLLELD